METQRHSHRLRLAGCILVASLAACGGGGGSGDSAQSSSAAPGSSSSSAAATPSISLAATSVSPFQQIPLTVNNPVDGSSYMALVDPGNGNTYQVPVQKLSETQLSLTAPPVAVTTTNNSLNLGAGSITVSIGRADSSGVYHYSQSQSVAISALPAVPSGTAAGDPTLAWLKASKLVLLQSQTNLHIAQISDKNINTTSMSKAANQAAQNIDAMIAAVQSIQANSNASVKLGSVNGTTLVLNSSSLSVLDQLATAQIQQLESSVTGTTVDASTSKMAKASDYDEEAGSTISFDPQTIANDLVNKLVPVVGTVGNSVSTITGVVAAVAAIAGAPEIAAAAVPIAAVAFLATTLPTTAIAITLESGTDAILNGQASVQSFEQAGTFLVNQYVDQAISTLQDSALDEMFGTLGQNVISAAQSAYQSYQSVTSQVNSDFQSGALSTGGVSPAAETLALGETSTSSTASSYQVTTTPSMSSGTLDVVVTDSAGNEQTTAVSISNGSGSFSVNAPASTDDFQSIEVLSPTTQSSAMVDNDPANPGTSDTQSVEFTAYSEPPSSGSGSSDTSSSGTSSSGGSSTAGDGDCGTGPGAGCR
jgi:hypothetical protein